MREHYYKYIINFIIIDCKFNQGLVPYSNVLRPTIQTCIYKTIMNKNGKDITLSVYLLKMIETDTVLQRILKYDFFRLLFYSYFYKCDVLETCFVGLTVIKSIIANNLFNHYKHNWWSQNHEAWTWCVHVPSHLVSRKIYCSRCKTCTKRSYLLTIQNYNKHLKLTVVGTQSNLYM